MKILVVEDEPGLAEVIKRSLERELFIVELAADHATAVRKIADFEYDLVLLDIMLPGGSGLDVLRALKEAGKGGNVIIISAKDSLEDKLAGLDLGADDYLTKPFHIAELNARVRSVLRRKALDGSNTIDVANLLLDTGHQKLAYIAGQPNASTNTDREKGFTDRLRERGVTSWLREQGDFTYQSGYEAAMRLLCRQDRPDAIFAAGDNMALAAMDAARYGLGLRVPEDVSIIGFDDIPMSSWPAYQLTTVAQQVDQMVNETIQLILDKIEDISSKPVMALVPGKMLIRKSVRGV